MWSLLQTTAEVGGIFLTTQLRKLKFRENGDSPGILGLKGGVGAGPQVLWLQDSLPPAPPHCSCPRGTRWFLFALSSPESKGIVRSLAWETHLLALLLGGRIPEISGPTCSGGASSPFLRSSPCGGQVVWVH